MEITNFDKLIHPHSKQISRHHHLMPDCHYIIIGSTGAGKTN